MNELSSLKSLTKNELLVSTHAAVKSERASTLKVLWHFQEMDCRKLYKDHGYSSLFEMAVKHFGYSGAGAQGRIHSMRLVRDFPELESKIKSGELSLSVAANVQSFFRETPSLPMAERRQVLSSCMNKSVRQVDKELASRNPKRDKKENIRFSCAERLPAAV